MFFSRLRCRIYGQEHTVRARQASQRGRGQRDLPLRVSRLQQAILGQIEPAQAHGSLSRQTHQEQESSTHQSAADQSTNANSNSNAPIG